MWNREVFRILSIYESRIAFNRSDTRHEELPSVRSSPSVSGPSWWVFKNPVTDSLLLCIYIVCKEVGGPSLY